MTGLGGGGGRRLADLRFLEAAGLDEDPERAERVRDGTERQRVQEGWGCRQDVEVP